METQEIIIKTSKSAHQVPVIDGIHLHSIYDPIREAASLIENHNQAIKKKNTVLVFGLGFAYHIESLIKKLSEYHDENFKIVVIEPNQKLIDEFLKEEKTLKNTEVKYAKEAESLYNQKDIVEFLMSAPVVINHPPSFNLNKEYFTAFMKYQAPKNTSEVVNVIENETFKEYLGDFNPERSLWENLHEQKKNQDYKITSNDYYLFALETIQNEGQA